MKLKYNILLAPDDQLNGGGVALEMPAATPAPAGEGNHFNPYGTNDPVKVAELPAASVEGDNTMDDFMKAKGKGYTSPEALSEKKEAPTPASQKEGDDKAKSDLDKANSKPTGETKVDHPIDPKPAPDALPKLSLNPTVKKSSERDYSDLDEEEKFMFGEMGNKAFSKIKPLYLEYKKIKPQLEAANKQVLELQTKQNNGLPQSYYEHESSYTLTPEYSQAQANIQQLQLEHGHWGEQLKKIKAAEKWQDLGLNQKGQVVKMVAADASPDAEEYVRGKMLEAQQLYRQTEGELNGMAQGHKAKVQQGIAQLKNAENTYFPFYADPAKVPAEDQKIIDNAIKALPEAFRGSQMATLLGKAYAVCVRLQQQVTELQGKVGGTIEQQVQEDARKAGPTSAKLGAAPAANGNGQDEDVMGKFAALTGRRF